MVIYLTQKLMRKLDIFPKVEMQIGLFRKLNIRKETDTKKPDPLAVLVKITISPSYYQLIDLKT